MKLLRLLAILAVVTLASGAFAAAPAAAPQVLAPGIADLNQLPERDLAALPGMTPEIAKAFVAKRPFASIVDANAFLLDQKLTQAQITAIYEKAFVPLAGVPLLGHALRGVLSCATVAQVVLVVPDTHREQASAVADGVCRELGSVTPVTVVPGGVERGDSVAAGLRALGDEVDIVLVHDAAR